MFHIALFWGVVEQDKLLGDGLSTDTLLPEFPLKRAMAGGWKIEYHRPICPGDDSGFFAHIDRHLRETGFQRAADFLRDYHQNRNRFRYARPDRNNNPDSAVSKTVRLNSIKLGDALPAREFTCTNVQQFLYNAALWNAHRIHFDHLYATGEEGYPGLVVAGPLMGRTG